ncbi:SAM-dependent methyltransferase [Actinomadura macrotermitis]|uniref:Bacterial transcriptional activator domain-containing protein n=1 Tax=Actinomadura macrotermitis TaxID=2585200 RepID=A0A7K0BWP5_9ACTN|nr:SAM-dependent methyltransferase [Actinomadura macrotermitis]MQY05587.1 hypothetical protein [Actinomadura macrotermitis]
MRISLIGELMVEDDQGRPVDLEKGSRRRQQSVRELICAVAMQSPGAISTRELKALLWDVDSTQDYTSALTTRVYKARKALGPLAERLVTEPAPLGGRQYRFALGPGDHIDVAAFREGVKLAKKAQQEGLLSEAAAHLQQALTPWRGVPFRQGLPDLPDTPAANWLRHPLLTQRRSAVEAYIGIQLDLGRHSPALVEQITEYLTLDPVNEVLHCRLMLTWYRLGRRTEALRTYQQAAEAMEAELGAAPGALLQRMREQILAEDETLLWRAPEQPQQRPLPVNTIDNVGVTDYLLGGKNNTAAQRAWVQAAADGSDTVKLPAENRECMIRMVEVLARDGIRQFLDLGSGMPVPEWPHVHEVARRVSAQTPRVVYVDCNADVAIHTRALVIDNRSTFFLEADLQEADKVLDYARRHLDLSEPVGLLSANTLQYVGEPDEDLGTDDVVKIIRRYVGALAPGSAWAMTHLSGDRLHPRQRPYIDSRNPDAAIPQNLRSPEQIERLMVGLPLMPPGLTDVGNWRPEQPYVQRPMRILGAVGRVMAAR